MAVIWSAPRPGEEGSVGHVRTTLTVTNRVDQALAARGVIRPEEVRTVTLDNVMVDTGATLLGLARRRDRPAWPGTSAGPDGNDGRRCPDHAPVSGCHHHPAWPYGHL
jgi:hypothetical protein